MTKTPIKSAEDTVQILIRAVPKSIHSEFKAVCVMRNTTIRARLIELMKTDVWQQQQQHNK